MKTFNTRISNELVEHTPIYDLKAYQQRQRILKRKQILRNLLDTTVFFSVSTLVFSIFFWGV